MNGSRSETRTLEAKSGDIVKFTICRLSPIYMPRYNRFFAVQNLSQS